MSGTHLTPDEDAKVASLYASGLSESQVSERIGRSRNAVQRSMKRQGIKARTANEGQCARIVHDKGYVNPPELRRTKPKQEAAPKWAINLPRVCSVFHLAS